jgi:hypothetical protein
MIANFDGASKTTATTLRFVSKQAEANNDFRMGTAESQAGSINIIGKSMAQLSSFSAVDLAGGSIAAQNRVRALSDDTESHMRNLAKKIASYLALARGTSTAAEAELLARIGSDSNELQLQSLLTKRSVRHLLGVWAKYAEKETQKFVSIRDSDLEFRNTVESRFGSHGVASSGDLAATFGRLRDLDRELHDSVANHLKFEASLKSRISNNNSSLKALDETSEASIQQLQGMVKNLDGNDLFLDGRDRTEVLNMIANFGAQMDSVMKTTMNSIR